LRARREMLRGRCQPRRALAEPRAIRFLLHLSLLCVAIDHMYIYVHNRPHHRESGKGVVMHAASDSTNWLLLPTALRTQQLRVTARRPRQSIIDYNELRQLCASSSSSSSLSCAILFAPTP
jgi:hypothetical protein